MIELLDRHLKFRFLANTEPNLSVQSRTEDLMRTLPESAAPATNLGTDERCFARNFLINE